jgi:hypothetical protein
MKINPTPASIWMRYPVRSRKPKSAAVRWAVLFFLASAIIWPGQSQAQEVPRLQLFGGYAYTRFESSTLGFAGGSNLNGWNTAVAWNLTPNFGGIAELTGQYGNHVNLRDFAAGPQFLLPHGKMVFFAHLLFGKGRTFVSQGVGAEDTQNAFLLGGGVDMSFRRHFDIRIIQADYVRTELLQGTQNNARLSAGVVYRWGEARRRKHRPPTTQAP